MRKFMRAKIHQARVTQCDLNYVGSITIDEDLLRAVDIRPNEAVHVYDIDNGSRFETYVILGKAGSGEIGVNGAAARLTGPGHRLIIVAFEGLEGEAVPAHESRVVVCDENNRITQRLVHPSAFPGE